MGNTNRQPVGDLKITNLADCRYDVPTIAMEQLEYLKRSTLWWGGEDLE